jgi:hypothetical protein
MNKMKSRTILLITAFLCTNLLLQSQIRITFNPEKDETYTYRFITDENSNQSVGGQETTTGYRLEFIIDMNINNKNNDEIHLDYIFKEIIMSFSSPMMNFTIDSKNKADNSADINKFFDCLIGKSLQFIVSPDGSVKTITGFQPIMEDVQKVIASANETDRRIIGMFIQMSFHEFAVKTSFEQSFKMYPDKEIKVGGNWSIDKSTSVSTITNNVINTYTLKSINEDIALIDLAVVSLMKNESLNRELKEEQKGEIKLNTKSGLPIQSSLLGNSSAIFNVQGTDMKSEKTKKVTVSLQ